MPIGMQAFLNYNPIRATVDPTEPLAFYRTVRCSGLRRSDVLGEIPPPSAVWLDPVFLSRNFRPLWFEVAVRAVVVNIKGTLAHSRSAGFETCHLKPIPRTCSKRTTGGLQGPLLCVAQLVACIDWLWPEVWNGFLHILRMT